MGDYTGDTENLIVAAFGETLTSEESINRIKGGAGNDYMKGAAGADKFVFKAGSGVDAVIDFTKAQSDKIHLQCNLNGSGITTGAQALAHTFDFGGNAVVDLGGTNSTLCSVRRRPAWQRAIS